MSGLCPAPREQMFSDDFECVFFVVTFEYFALPQRHHTAVLHGRLEGRSCENEAVEESDREARSLTGGQAAKKTASGGAVEQDAITVTCVANRHDVRLTIRVAHRDVRDN